MRVDKVFLILLKIMKMLLDAPFFVIGNQQSLFSFYPDTSEQNFGWSSTCFPGQAEGFCCAFTS